MSTKSKTVSQARKIIATIFLAPPTLAVIAFVYNLILQVQANTLTISQNTKDIAEMKTEVKQVHWYLIKRNDVQVPKYLEEKHGK